MALNDQRPDFIKGDAYCVAGRMPTDLQRMAESDAKAAFTARAVNAHDDLVAALEGMLHEWDKLTRYGSPLAKAANERVAAARAALAKAAQS